MHCNLLCAHSSHWLAQRTQGSCRCRRMTPDPGTLVRRDNDVESPKIALNQEAQGWNNHFGCCVSRTVSGKQPTALWGTQCRSVRTFVSLVFATCVTIVIPRVQLCCRPQEPRITHTYSSSRSCTSLRSRLYCHSFRIQLHHPRRLTLANSSCSSSSSSRNYAPRSLFQTQ